MIKKFLNHIWPDTGYYCIAVPKSIEGGKPYYQHIVKEEIEQAVNYIQNNNPEVVDYYMAVGSLGAEQLYSEKKKKYQVRSAENVTRFKSLILDIDCGPKKPYASQADASNSLLDFLSENKSGLPKPTVVSSGYGLHVYFTFEESVTAEVWLQMAEQLRALAEYFKLWVDDSRTTDRASVLRIPGTLNHKDKNNPKPVKVMRWGTPTPPDKMQIYLDRAVKDFKVKVNKPKTYQQPQAKLGDSMSAELRAYFKNIEVNILSVNGELVFQKCNMMKQIRIHGGRVGYRAWWGGLMVVRKFDYPVYSEISDGDPNYDEGYTLSLVADMEAQDYEAAGCDYFRKCNEGPEASWCNDCPYSVRSPIDLGKKLKDTTSTTSTTLVTIDVIPEKVIEHTIEIAKIPKNNVQDGEVATEEISEDIEIWGTKTEDVKDISAEIPEDDIEDGFGGTTEEPATREFLGKLELVIGEGDGREILKTSYGDVYLPDPPIPYKRGEKGVYYIAEDDEEGGVTFESIYENDVFPCQIQNGGETGVYSVNIRLKLPFESFVEFEVPFNALPDSRAFAKLFADKGVIIPEEVKSEMFLKYMKSYIIELQNKMRSVKTHPQLGWLEDRDGFVLPNRTLLPDGTEYKSVMLKGVQGITQHISKKGTLEEWKKVINTYSRPQYETHAFGHLVGYGSILLSFTDHSGAIVSLSGKSGSGKSTVLRTINSMFGHPKDLMLIDKDTYNSKIQQIGILNSLCATYDEITNIAEDQLSDFCYTITQGRGRHRLNQNAELKENNTRWKLLVASTSNDSLIDKLGGQMRDSTAEKMRVFEYRVDPLGLMTKSEADQIFDIDLAENYGHAGEIFLNYVVKNQQIIQDRIRKMALKFDKAADIISPERFWSAAVSTSLVGGAIAKELGLNDYDTDHLFDWCVEQVNLMRDTVAEGNTSPTDLLSAFLNNNLSSALKVPPEEGYYDPMAVPRGRLLIRSEEESGKAYVDRKALGKWFREHGGDFSQIKRDLLTSRVLLNANVSKVLGAGCKYLPTTGQTKCWLIDVSHRDMANKTKLTDVSESIYITADNTMDIDAVDKKIEG